MSQTAVPQAFTQAQPDTLEYVIFALAIGLAINHTVAIPAWLREAARTEFYIKTGLVVLGATIIFDEIAAYAFFGGWLFALPNLG